jgi:hypothetical protein
LAQSHAIGCAASSAFVEPSRIVADDYSFEHHEGVSIVRTSSFLSFTLVAVALGFGAGCLKSTVDVLPGSGGHGGSQTTSSGPELKADGIAIRWSDALSNADGTTVGSTTSSGGGGVDPNGLLITVYGGGAQTSCKAPFGGTYCGGWSVSFTLPPALQKPGVVSLADPNLHASFSMGGGSGDECWGGGGSFTEGGVEIVSIDDKAIALKLTGTNTLEFDANGSHTALLCSKLPVVPKEPPQKADGLAIHYGHIGNNGPYTAVTVTSGYSSGYTTTTTSTGGTTVASTSAGGGEDFDDPKDLLLVIDPSGAATCGSPYQSGSCPYWRVSLRLPVELQKPGTLPLNDNRLRASFSASDKNKGNKDCWWGGGSFVDGTITISSIDASSVKVKLQGTLEFGFKADGEYVLPVCK